MKGRILLPLIIIFFTGYQLPGFSQSTDREITLSRDQAMRFIQKSCRPFLWKDPRDSLRSALEQLILEASNPPFDSIESFLKKYPYDSLSIPWEKFFVWEPIRVKVKSVQDTLSRGSVKDTIPRDSMVVRQFLQGNADLPEGKDSTIMIIVDTLTSVSSSARSFPFRYYKFPYQSDSIRAAVNVLVNYLEERDSGLISITGISGRKISTWLNSKSDKMVRYWLRNDLNDSVTVWIGSPERNTLGLYLEHGVSFRRPAMQGNVSDARVIVEELDKSKLLDIQKILTKTQYWKYRTESAFSLNQGLLANWVKGGESSVAASLDLTAYFDYSNKPMLISSNHFARIKLGMIYTEDKGLMKNLDLIETNSKFNHKAFGKFDFSAIMLFKTQIAKGFNYTKVKVNGEERDTAILVSKFFNPATLTIGLGLDYKPNKLTSINFSPLSYKATFVPDTSVIDQTKYGVAENRRSKHEPGASFLISNEFRPVRSVVVTNRLQLFTNYINNPLNIDVDWEMIVVANLNWFTDVRLNTHLIFDDDTKTLLFKRNEPVMGQDGIQKKTARVQFKEMLGLSFVFRF